MKNVLYFLFILFAFITMLTTFALPQDKVGLLILAHGGHSSWDETVTQAVKPLKEKYAVEIAFGMADPKTMQAGINKLEAQGVNTIVVTQLFISSYSPIIRQNEYLLGLRDELADEPMIMDHSGFSHGNNHADMQNTPNVELKPLNIKSKILLTEPLNDHPLVVEILSERVKELSKSPVKETVILVAHGPNDEEDNRMWVSTLDNIADKLRAKYTGTNSFKNIFCMTVRDDAAKEIYEAAKENLRNIVRQASKDGKAIVVPVLLSQGGIEKGIVKRLEGLEYEWSGKTLLPHENITKFIETSVEGALKTEAAKL
ncbi:MAG: CbiX/SirB N-terminal domain-containing protein [Ignavibacteriaceae bacterium]